MSTSMPRKGEAKKIGYFSYSHTGDVFCDGDACIIANSKEAMRRYLTQLPQTEGRYVIKQTRVGEVMQGLAGGGAYAFDSKSYQIFLQHAKQYHIMPLLNKIPQSASQTGMHFIRIQMLG